jgi:hypothetical protein
MIERIEEIDTRESLDARANYDVVEKEFGREGARLYKEVLDRTGLRLDAVLVASYAEVKNE